MAGGRAYLARDRDYFISQILFGQGLNFCGGKTLFPAEFNLLRQEILKKILDFKPVKYVCEIIESLKFG